MADILRKHGPAYVEKYGRRVVLVQRRVLADLTACRTRAMGSYADRCTYCGSSFFGGFNSCRNRHCPSCGGPTRARWLNQVRALVLPIPHFHLTFTLPDTLSRLILANRRVLYNLLFRSAWETIRQLAADPKLLGGETGALMVLHTWNQQLDHHPHVHVIVPAGVRLPDDRWNPIDPEFFLHHKILADVFRGKFLDGLKCLHARGKLQVQGKLSCLADASQLEDWLKKHMYKHRWGVNIRPAPSARRGPEAVLKYLARYVAGAAISDQRLISYDGKHVHFWVQDRDNHEHFPVQLEGLEFTRRFLMHVLPKGFQRVRYRGLFHIAKRNTVLCKIREQLAAQSGDDHSGREQDSPASQSADAADTPATSSNCPACGVGRLKKVTSRNTPDHWLQVLDASPFRPPWSKCDELDLADWTPVLPEDPPAPLRCLSQLYLRLVDDELPVDDTQVIERCRGQPATNSLPQAA